MTHRTSRKRAQHRPRKVNVAQAERVAATIRELSAHGLDPDDVLTAVAAHLPGISLREFCGGLALHRASSGVDAYAIFHEGQLQ
jgi:hypothetical protein